MTTDPLRFGAVRAWYPRVASTMDVAMTLARAGAPHGTLVETAQQTAGRGRFGRRWHAPAGSAFLGSWLLRAPGEVALAGLSPAIGAAVLRAVDAVAPGAPIQFKWPNDVLIDDRKVAGILLTSRAAPAGVVVIAGTGVNVHPESMPPDVEATCLSAWAATDVDAVRQRLAAELGRAWARILAAGGLPPADRLLLEARMAWQGVPIDVMLPDRPITGTIAGLAADGGLRLRAHDGRSERVLHVGEIARGPRPTSRTGPETAVYLPEHDDC